MVDGTDEFLCGMRDGDKIMLSLAELLVEILGKGRNPLTNKSGGIE